MKLIELLNTVPLPDVLREIEAEYTLDIYDFEGYQAAFDELRATTANPSDGSSIIVSRYVEDGEGLWHVGLDDVDGKQYSLSFIPWADLLNHEVRIKDCDRDGGSDRNTVDLTPAQMLAHVLWEITFYGYSSVEIGERDAELSAIVAEFNDLIETLPETSSDEGLESIGLKVWHPKPDTE